jgi:hypothetical protein
MLPIQYARVIRRDIVGFNVGDCPVNAVFAPETGEVCRLIDEARGRISIKEVCEIEAVT